MIRHPKVLISIVNWNGRDYLESCLKSISEHTDYDNYEILVVDNGSTDNSIELLEDKYPGAKIIKNAENKGFGEGNNQAFRYALKNDFEFVSLVNNDLVIKESGWLSELVDVAKSNELGIVSPKIVTADGEDNYNGEYLPKSKYHNPIIYKYFQYNRHNQSGGGDYVIVDSANGACMLVNTKVIESSGGFDSIFSPAYFEETDLCLRAWANGFMVAYYPHIEVTHHHMSSTKDSADHWREYLMLRNRLYFITIHYPLTWILQSVPSIILQYHRFIPKYRGDVNDYLHQILLSIYFYFVSYYEYLANFRQILKRRSQKSNIPRLLK